MFSLPSPKTVDGIRGILEMARESAEGSDDAGVLYVGHKMPFDGIGPVYSPKHLSNLVEDVKCWLWQAGLDDDRLYIKNFLKAMHGVRREPQMHGIRAAIQAFWDLFVSPGFYSKDDWPSKQEVRKRAEEILREAGQPISEYDRSWSRIFNEAGLSELLSVKQGPAP